MPARAFSWIETGNMRAKPSEGSGRHAIRGWISRASQVAVSQMGGKDVDLHYRGRIIDCVIPSQEAEGHAAEIGVFYRLSRSGTGPKPGDWLRLRTI